MIHADAIEERLWTRQEKAMQEYHEMKLAWTLMPRSEADLAIILKHFPEITFQNGKGESARLTYKDLQLSTWSAPVPFAAMESLEVKESMGRKILTVKFRQSGKTEKLKLQPATFKSPKGDLLAALGQYYGRYQTAVANPAQQG